LFGKKVLHARQDCKEGGGTKGKVVHANKKKGKRVQKGGRGKVGKKARGGKWGGGRG